MVIEKTLLQIKFVFTTVKILQLILELRFIRLLMERSNMPVIKEAMVKLLKLIMEMALELFLHIYQKLKLNMALL